MSLSTKSGYLGSDALITLINPNNPKLDYAAHLYNMLSSPPPECGAPLTTYSLQNMASCTYIDLGIFTQVGFLKQQNLLGISLSDNMMAMKILSLKICQPNLQTP
jgi:hypothetical protein